MDFKEKFLSLLEKFDPEKIEEFISLMVESYEGFKEGVSIGHELSRSCKEFENLKKYHLAAFERENYKELYYKLVHEKGI